MWHDHHSSDHLSLRSTNREQGGLADMIEHLIATLEADEELMGFAHPSSQRIFASSSLGIGDHPAEPKKLFLVWNELEPFIHREVEDVSNARDRNIFLWAYDEEGDYTKVDLALFRFRAIVKGMRDFVTADGVRVFESRFTGFSGNLTDSQYHSSCKWASARFTASQ